MTGANQLTFGIFMGAIAMAVVNLAIAVAAARGVKLQADQREKEACPEKPDQAAYMGRKPGEPYSMERCLYVMRQGDPAWVPQLGAPLLVSGGVKGRPGLEQQLQWVRIECHRLAKQIKQRC